MNLHTANKLGLILALRFAGLDASAQFEVLASGADPPISMSVEPPFVYFSFATSLWRVPTQGGASTLLTAESGGRFAIVGDNLVWHYGSYQGMSIYRVNKAGGVPESLASASGGALLGVIEDQAYYMSGFSNLKRVPVSGGSPQSLLDCGFARASAADNASLYFHEYTSGDLRKYTAISNSLTTVLESDGGDGNVFLDQDFVYYSPEGGGTIKRIPKAGGAAVTLINDGGSYGWVADGTNVFYVLGGELRAIPRDGGTARTLASLNGRTVTAAAVDHGYVYVGDYGAGFGRVVRVPKDAAVGVVDIASAAYDVSETVGSIIVVLNRTGGTSGSASVMVSTQFGTAAQADFSPISQVVTFAHGESSKTLNLAIVDDRLIEADETFTISLSNPSYAFRVGAIQMATVTILNDDVDTDGDGMLDAWEVEFGLDKNADDRFLDGDSDGLTNWLEWQLFSRPDSTDTNGDGISDATSYLSGRNPAVNDSDNDGIPDLWEEANGLNPLANDADNDPDGDGLTSAQEYNGGVNSTNPRNRDSDGNGVSDYEQRNGEKYVAHRYDQLDRLVSTSYDNGAWEGWRYDGNGNILRHILRIAGDADNDGLADAWEFSNGLSFTSSSGTQGFGGDADGDGWTNYQEFLADTGASNASSFPPTSSGAVVWANPPIARIIFPPLSGGAWSLVKVRLWDAEANNAQSALQWYDSTLQQWRAATVLKVNNGPASGLSSLATSPSGQTHDLVWDALSGLGSSFNGTILLRTTTQDAAGATNSEAVPYSVNTAGDFDGDGMPDAWEIARGLDPNDSTGANGGNADIDNDGLNNFGEFVFGLSLGASDAKDATTTGTAINPADGKSYLTLTYRRRLDAAANGLTYSVQTSTDLTTWTTNGPDVEAVETTPTGDGITELVTVRIKPPLEDPDAKKFARVQVSK